MSLTHKIPAASRRLVVLFSLFVVLVLAGGCGSPGRAAPTPTPWPTPIVSEKPIYTVQRGTVVQRFTLSGQVVPVVWEALFFTVDGKLASLNVTIGSEVNQGDILAELDTSVLDDQLAQAQLSLEQAQDQYDQQQASSSFALERARYNLQLQQLALEKLQRTAQQAAPVQKDMAEQTLARARLNLQKAQAEYDKISWRSDAGATPQALALQQATIEYQIAEDQYKLQSLSDLDIQIASQQIQVNLAQLALKELEQRTDPTLERNLTKARLQVQALQRQIEARRLRTPYAGKIVAVGLNQQGFQTSLTQRPKIGDTIPAFAPLIVIAKPGSLEVVVPGDSAHATDLTVGQTVTITHSLAPNRPFSGQVVALPIQTLATGAQPSQPQSVRISLPADAPAMSIGDHVDIDVVNKVHNDTLFLPPPAVRTFNGRTFVVVRSDGKERRVDVTLGLANDTQVEILSGLNEGDAVVGQ